MFSPIGCTGNRGTKGPVARRACLFGTVALCLLLASKAVAAAVIQPTDLSLINDLGSLCCYASRPILRTSKHRPQWSVPKERPPPFWSTSAWIAYWLRLSRRNAQSNLACPQARTRPQPQIPGHLPLFLPCRRSTLSREGRNPCVIRDDKSSVRRCNALPVRPRAPHRRAGRAPG